MYPWVPSKNVSQFGPAVWPAICEQKALIYRFNLYLNLACLFVCLFVSKKRQNG